MVEDFEQAGSIPGGLETFGLNEPVRRSLLLEQIDSDMARDGNVVGCL
jgi:hypothetical protein